MQSGEENWADDKQKEIDLRLENQSLETELQLKGAVGWKSPDLDPRIENEFLRNVMAFEEAAGGPAVPMRSLFPEDYEFPPAESLSSEQLSAKLDEIADILSRNHIEFGFVGDLPDMVLYKHLVEDVIPNDSIETSTGTMGVWVLDGCTGCCEECFQHDYCETARELDEEERNG
jgi:hypothetical protein